MLVSDPDGVVDPWWSVQLNSLVGVVIEMGAPPTSDGFTRVVAGRVQGFLPLEGVVDLDAERARLSRALAAATEDFELADRKLSKDSFRERAPAEVVAKEELKRTEAEATIAKLQAQLDELGPA